MDVLVVLADDARLQPLKPDPSWDVQGVRDLVGGVMALCIVLSVALIILGVLSMIPGLVSNNMMERAFNWKRLAAALLVPVVVGACASSAAWGYEAFGSQGLTVNGSYQSAEGVDKNSAERRNVGDQGWESHSEGLADLVGQLGSDIVKRMGDTVKQAVKDALDVGGSVQKWFSDGWDKAKDTVGGAVDKAKDAIGDVVDKAKDAVGGAVGKVQEEAGKIKDKITGLF